MRTEKRWKENIYPKILKNLSPRLQQDVIIFPPEDLPPVGSYYLYGPTGTGKSTMAAHMYINAWHQKYMESLPGSIIWATFNDMLMNIRKAMNRPKWEEQSPPDGVILKDEFAVMAEYQTASHLFLDDLGDIKFTDWNLSQLGVLINYRYENLLPMVITSNLSLKELAEATGDARIPSRIGRICKTLKLK